MSNEKQSNLASEMLRDVSQLCIKYLLIAYGVFFVTLFTTLSKLEKDHWLVEPIGVALNFLTFGFIVLVGGIVGYLLLLIFTGSDVFTKIFGSVSSSVSAFTLRISSLQVYVMFFTSCVALCSALGVMVRKLTGDSVINTLFG